jgi:hypothetical protein
LEVRRQTVHVIVATPDRYNVRRQLFQKTSTQVRAGGARYLGIHPPFSIGHSIAASHSPISHRAQGQLPAHAMPCHALRLDHAEQCLVESANKLATAAVVRGNPQPFGRAWALFFFFFFLGGFVWLSQRNQYIRRSIDRLAELAFVNLSRVTPCVATSRQPIDVRPGHELTHAPSYLASAASTAARQKPHHLVIQDAPSFLWLPCLRLICRGTGLPRMCAAAAVHVLDMHPSPSPVPMPCLQHRPTGPPA